MNKIIWRMCSYQSGTHIVKADVQDVVLPYYYVYADNRYYVTKQLEYFLNYGLIPKWFNSLKKVKNEAIGDKNIRIFAVGDCEKSKERIIDNLFYRGELSIGEKIKYYRKKKKSTLAYLSEISGYSKGYISDLENNKILNPSANALYSISICLDININYLLNNRVSYQ